MRQLPNLELATIISFAAGSAVISFRGGETLTVDGDQARQIAIRVGAPAHALDAPAGATAMAAPLQRPSEPVLATPQAPAGAMLLELPDARTVINLENAVRVDLPASGDVAMIIMGSVRSSGPGRPRPQKVRITGAEDLRRIRAAVGAPAPA